MLTGTTSLPKCYSSSIVRVHMRFAFTLFQSSLSSTQVVSILRTRSKCSRQLHTAVLIQTLATNDASTCVRTARFSTTVKVLSRPRTPNAKFLKPRGKPKFRLRGDEENDDFLRALREAQNEYDAKQAEFLGEEQGNHGENESETSSKWSKHSMISPFFAIPDTSLFTPPRSRNDQNKHYKPADIARGFPKRTRLSRDQASTADLESELYYLAHNDPNPTAIHSILQILISDRQLIPTSQHYEALILANTWPEYGGVQNVEKILSEMENEGYEIGVNIIAAVLKVLAVHPSPELSHSMLAMAERRWIQLPLQSYHHVILAMIRTGQTELAALTLDMRRRNDRNLRSWNREVVPDYLVVLLLAEIVSAGDWEGMLRYVYKLRGRRAADRDIPVRFWGWLLEQAAKTARNVAEAESSPSIPRSDSLASVSANTGTSRQLQSPLPQADNASTSPDTPTPDTNEPLLPHHLSAQFPLSNPSAWLVEYLWTHYVEPMSHRPTWSTCVDILHLASISGVPYMAESVVYTMTYLDGVDENFKPKVSVSPELKKLAVIARRRAGTNESEDNKRLRFEVEEAEKVRAEKQVEIDAWWTDFTDRCARSKEERDRFADSDTDTDVATTGTSNKTAYVEQQTQKDADSASTELPPSALAAAINSKHQNKSLAIHPFDASTIIPGNMWPLFPSIDGIGSPIVDPWEALGSRSSSRRKWTDAQEYYKKIERTKRAEKKRVEAQQSPHKQ